MDSVLRPRDIQARIRSGESPEQVAEAAQTSVDRIMPFAGPVIAERAHIAATAQRSSVRRRAGDSGARTLGECIETRMREENVEPASVEWDAWRRPDGRWTLVADFALGGSPRHAEFIYDNAGRYVVAEDVEAKWLVSDAPAPHVDAPAFGPGAENALATLTAVPDQVETVGAGGGVSSEDDPRDQPTLGDDAIAIVAGGSRHLADSPAESVARGEAEPAPEAEADWLASTPVGGASEPAAAAVEPDADTEPDPDTEPTAEVDLPGQDALFGSPDPEPAVEADEPESRARKSSKRRGRASVPSWDEIMFGGPKD